MESRQRVINRPIVPLIVDSSGRSNLPNPQSSTNSNTDVFDLKVGHILFDRGEVYYNDRKSALDANLQNLQFKSNYDATAGGRYSGSLSYGNGSLHYGSYSSLDHYLQAQFDARRNGITLSNVTLKSGESQILLDASLENYANPQVQSKYVVTLVTADIRRLLNNSLVPVGMIVVNGRRITATFPDGVRYDLTEGTVAGAAAGPHAHSECRHPRCWRSTLWRTAMRGTEHPCTAAGWWLNRDGNGSRFIW
jgi:hypothetical protein